MQVNCRTIGEFFVGCSDTTQQSTVYNNEGYSTQMRALCLATKLGIALPPSSEEVGRVATHREARFYNITMLTFCPDTPSKTPD